MSSVIIQTGPGSCIVSDRDQELHLRITLCMNVDSAIISGVSSLAARCCGSFRCQLCTRTDANRLQLLQYVISGNVLNSSYPFLPMIQPYMHSPTLQCCRFSGLNNHSWDFKKAKPLSPFAATPLLLLALNLSTHLPSSTFVWVASFLLLFVLNAFELCGQLLRFLPQ